MAWGDVRQANQSEEFSRIWQSGQKCDQDVLLYRISLVHPSGPHRDGPDILDEVKASLIIHPCLNDRINGENCLAPLQAKRTESGTLNQNRQEKLN